MKTIRKIIYFWPLLIFCTLFFVGCNKQPQEKYTIACDASGNPVFVTVK